VTRIAEAWRDPDKRRALLLSVAVHLMALLLLAVFVTAPKPRKLDHYLVITLGSPQKSQTQTQAPAAEAAAPQASQAQVASGAIGEPQARSAPKPRPQAPQPQQATTQPPAPAQPEPKAPQKAPQPQTPPVTAQAPAPTLSPPSQAAPVKPAPAEPTGTTAATLPEIKPVQLPPNQPPPAITIPKPQAQAEVPQAMALAITPQTHVSPARKLPSPQASAQVAQAQVVPRPQASASVARTLSAPQARAEVTPAQPLPSPQARAQVTPAQSLQAPQATAQVAAPRPLTGPQASASVAPARPLSAPQATATAGTARNLAVTPQVSVSAPLPVPVPTIRAQVRAPAASAGAPSSSGAPPGNTDVASPRAGNRTPGGNAPTAGQVGGTTQANAAGRGSATSPNGSATGTGAPAPSPAPFREELERPLAVLVDNVHGYPQSGLKQAASIIEMPVEGGLTRLMLIYDTADPGRVGPIRSARDYFVKLSDSMHAVLVHDGGSPGAMIAIKKGKLPTLDALHRGDLFSRGTQRKAPYNLYSQGDALRRAVNRLLPARTRVLTGTLYRPPQDAPTVTSVTDRFSSVYKTGFRYFPKLDSYRWVRNGKGADDASGENVLVDAVVMAKITARPLPDDPEGRLYIPLQGGPATLYLHGRAVAGHWDLNDGVQFVTAAGQPVDLAPFRTWFVMTPTYDSRVQQ
jgi:hypothetical protein